MKKPKKIKARRYWKTPTSLLLHKNKRAAQYFSGFDAKHVIRTYVLPADAASVERMVEQMAKAWCENAVPWDHIGYGAQQIRLKMFRVALAAIGIKGGAK